jgi:DNA-binding CsgD family transcriptional regulator
VQLSSKAFALGELGRLADAAELADVCYQEAVTAGSGTGQAWGALLSGRIALIAGHVGTATATTATFAEAAALFQDAGETPMLRWCLAGLALCESYLGRATNAEDAVAAIDATGKTDVQLLEVEIERARAWALAAAGDESAARRLLLAAAAEQDRVGAYGMALVALHEVARLDDARAARDALRPHHLAVQGELAAVRVAFIEALATGDPDALTAVAGQFGSLGADLFTAEALAAAGRLRARAGEARAAERLHVASARAAERCQGVTTVLLRTTRLTATLTRREREVATMAATGRSNKEIAAALAVSSRTVENHLQRAYLKLGVSGREALADVLRET